MFFRLDKVVAVAARYVLQAYNRRALRRNVEQSRALRFPDSGSESELDIPPPKVPRTKPRRHRPPRLKDSNSILDREFSKDDKCIEATLEGYPVIAFSSIKEYEDYRSGRLRELYTSYPLYLKKLPQETLNNRYFVS